MSSAQLQGHRVKVPVDLSWKRAAYWNVKTPHSALYLDGYKLGEKHARQRHVDQDSKMR